MQEAFSARLHQYEETVRSHAEVNEAANEAGSCGPNPRVSRAQHCGSQVAAAGEERVCAAHQAGDMTDFAPCLPSEDMAAEDILGRLEQFLEGAAGVSGATTDASSFSLDAEKLLAILQGTKHDLSVCASDDGASTASVDESECLDSDGDVSGGSHSIAFTSGPCQAPTVHDGGPSFMEEYMQHLDDEMLQKTGEKPAGVSIDMSCVANLLEAVEQNAGGPGAADGLLGMLGLRLPHGAGEQ
jgi:hypothetical protein